MEGAHGGDMDPFETLAPLVAAATVRIHAAPLGYAADGQRAPGAARTAERPWGSGFFVAPNWVLTCAHVALWGRGDTVADGGIPDVGVSFDGRTVRGRVEWAQPVENPGHGLWPAPDLALIRLLEPVPHRCVWLTERTSKVFTRKEVAFFGCAEEDGEVEDLSGRCTIRGELGRDGKLRLGSEDEIPEGASGGPVVDLARGEVIGVLKARRTGLDGGLAVSVVQLRRVPGGPPPYAAPPAPGPYAVPGPPPYAVPSPPPYAAPAPYVGDSLPSDGARGAGARSTERGRSVDDLYQRVMRAHDRHHADEHRNVHATRTTWTDAQAALGATAGRALTAGRRTELLGLLADLPPPISTASLQQTVDELRGQPCENLPLAPRSWRDGLGLLYDGGYGQTGELETILRYCVHAATADRPYPADPGTEQRLWQWADDLAAAVQLPRPFRVALAGQRAARLRAREGLITMSDELRPAPPHTDPVPGAVPSRPYRPGAATGPGAPRPAGTGAAFGQQTPVHDTSVRGAPGSEAAPRAAVMLEIIPRGWEPGRYDWRVCAVRPTGELVPMEEDFRGAALDPAPGSAPPDQLRDWLLEAFRRCDEPHRPAGAATLVVALPRALLGFPVDAWRLAPDGPPLGAERPVVVRCSDPPPESEEDAAARAKRWRGVHTGLMEPAVLDCEDGRPERVPDERELRVRGPRTVPILCRYADAAAEPAALHRIIGSGYPVALWRREPVDRQRICADFHRGATRAVLDTGQADRLPEEIRRLRAGIGLGEPETYWSQGITLLYDDPSRPLPGADDPLETP
ncbi:trypsin-like peptidase domain-containing protein [Streptomyces sp. URMC 123]|uniref:VMAP-C domain-containing protein n=1 Tax=Streptomyces sp. URMC 123 TaxID=3423403 RepID=UPI003F19EBF9